tara:strand:+ start:121 stop:300 length:180 start_codon:yes stop_codon:yes gene_type:complete
MITYKKTFDYCTTDAELDNYVNEIINFLMGDIDDEIELYLEEDINHRYITLNIVNQSLH